MVWDWERSTGPVPVGLDAVHAHFQPPLLNDGRTGPESASLALAGAGPVLTQLGHDGSCACGRDRLPPRAAAAPGRGRDQGILGDGQWFADAVAEAATEWKR